MGRGPRNGVQRGISADLSPGLIGLGYESGIATLDSAAEDLNNATEDLNGGAEDLNGAAEVPVEATMPKLTPIQ